MKKLLIVLLVLLFVGCDTPQEQNKKEIDNIKKELNLISSKLNAYKSPNLSEIKQKIDNLEQKINSLDNTEITKKILELTNEIKEIQKKQKTQNNNLGYIVIKPVTLITMKKSDVYARPNEDAKIIKEFPIHKTFTSYKEENNFIKVTGYFIHKKWVENDKEWWVKKSDCKIKIVEK